MDHPSAWLAELNDQTALLTGPDAWAAFLCVTAQAVAGRGDVDAGQPADMLELVRREDCRGGHFGVGRSIDGDSVDGRVKALKNQFRN